MMGSRRPWMQVRRHPWVFVVNGCREGGSSCAMDGHWPSTWHAQRATSAIWWWCRLVGATVIAVVAVVVVVFAVVVVVFAVVMAVVVVVVVVLVVVVAVVGVGLGCYVVVVVVVVVRDL